MFIFPFLRVYFVLGAFIFSICVSQPHAARFARTFCQTMMANAQIAVSTSPFPIVAEEGSLAASSPELQQRLLYTYLNTRHFKSEHYLSDEQIGRDLPKSTIEEWNQKRTGLAESLVKLVDESNYSETPFGRRSRLTAESARKAGELITQLHRDLREAQIAFKEAQKAANNQYLEAKKNDPSVKKSDYAVNENDFKLNLVDPDSPWHSQYHFNYPTAIYRQELQSILNEFNLSQSGRNRAIARILSVTDQKIRSDIAEIVVASHFSGVKSIGQHAHYVFREEFGVSIPEEGDFLREVDIIRLNSRTNEIEMIEVKDNVIANAHRLIDGNTSQPQRERAKNQPRRISDQGRRTANLWKYLDEQFKDTPFKMGPLRFYSTFLGNPYINQQQLSGVTSAFGSDFISGIDGPEIITRHLFNADDWNMRFRPNGFQPPIPPAPLKRQPQANIEN